MTQDQSIFTCLEFHNGGNVTFGDNGKRKIIEKGMFGKSPSIQNVYLIEGLIYNLLSISQLCDANKRVICQSSLCKVIDGETNNVLSFVTQVEEEEEVNLQAMFEELYDNSIKIAKNNKQLRKLVETLSTKNEELKNKMERPEEEYQDVTSINAELAQQVVEKDDELLKLLGGSQKLSTCY